MTRSTIASVFLLAALAYGEGSKSDFHWLNPRSDAQTFLLVSELLPANEYDQIREIGVVGVEALVITTKRDSLVAAQFEAPNYDFFRTYDVSLETKAVREIWSGYGLTFTGVFPIKMSPGKTGDFFVNYQTCSECEPTTMLASFFVDSDSRWQVRKWDKYAGLAVYYLGVEDESTTTVYAVKDFDSDGFDDIYVWTLYETGDPKDRKEYFESYSVKNGIPVKSAVSGVENVRRFKIQVCSAADAFLKSGQDSVRCRKIRVAVSGRQRKAN